MHPLARVYRHSRQEQDNSAPKRVKAGLQHQFVKQAVETSTSSTPESRTFSALRHGCRRVVRGVYHHALWLAFFLAFATLSSLRIFSISLAFHRRLTFPASINV
ncbi:hypothetical protein IQ06DRAFT_9753 [Phaeosphaeriaceae sp. SRC1lsM3a]|nr:hypothetical protein IQ06DRAFT_9753 [Stagonospora sp. SRC1lsM3a]